MKAFFKKLIKYTALFSAGAALSLGVLAGCSSEPAKKYVLPDSMSVILEPPQSGSPLDYSALENVGFIAGKLAMRDCYHVESESNVTAKVKVIFTIEAKQTVTGSKDYQNGILVTNAISKSENAFAPSKAVQRYFGDDAVYVRAPASDKKEDWSLDMQWSDAAPEVLNDENYTAAYGLRASEFSDFVINEETAPDAGTVQEQDGVYTLTLPLDPATAPAYYVNQMVTMGDLDEAPVFSKLNITVNFTADWTVLSVRTEEVYTSKKGITASCEGGSVITYSYDKADVDISAYEEYFRQYEKSAS